MERFERIGELASFPMFERCLGSRFRVVSDHRTAVEMTLIDATRSPSGGNPARLEPFALLFRGPTGHQLPQRTFTFGHDVLGAFEIFIVPIVPHEQGPRYEAVFN